MLRIHYLKFVCAALCALGLILWTTPAFSQAVASAEVVGQVVDPSGASLPGAIVKMIETNRGVSHQATTDADGRYTLTHLPVGPYRFEASKNGFKTYIQSGIILQVDDHIPINAALQVGAVSETVEVNAGGTLLQTESNSIANVVDSQRISNLPLNGRQATQLVLLTGASAQVAAPGDLSSSKNFYSSFAISVAGGQGNGTNYLLDGGDNNDTFSNANLPFPFPEALQEFNVETNTLPARDGLHPGGIVNIVTKSGTNSWHGDAFEFYRTGGFNARNTFAKTHDSLHRNQFGGDFGGKIIRDKLFFFGGYQGTRLSQVSNGNTAFVPTPAILNGDFSTFDGAGCRSGGTTLALKSPTGYPAFTNNQIPTNLFSPVSLKLLSFLPTTSDPCGKISYGVPQTASDNQVIGRVDWVQNQKHSLFGRYFIVNYKAPPPFNIANLIVTQNPGYDMRSQSMTIGDNYSISPTAINSFHFTFSRRAEFRGVDSRDIGPGTLGIQINPTIPNYLQVQLPNDFNIGCGTCTPAHLSVNTFQAADDFDLVRGKHQISFGADIIRTQNNTNIGYLENGSFLFGGQLTGDPMADFMLGLMSNGTPSAFGGGNAFAQSRPQQVAFRETIPGFYVQDVFHATPTLTINAGVRWEPMLFPTDLFHRGSVFDLNSFRNNVHSRVFPNAPAGMFFFGDPGVNKAFTHDKIANFAPRLGLAWNPHNGRQTFRVGAGIFYDSTMVWWSQRMTSNPPVVDEIDLLNVPVNGPANPGTANFANPWVGNPGGNPFPGVFPPNSSVTFPANGLWFILPQHFQPMYVAQWNASYQVQFGGDWLATISYLGNKSTHVPLSTNLNYALDNPTVCAATPGGCTTKTTTARRVLAQLQTTPSQNAAAIANLIIGDDGANANYNALLTSVQHRFGHHFTLLANYTYSHCLSQGDFLGDMTGGRYQNPTNRAAEYGPCNFDIRHNFNSSMVADSPVKGSGWQRWLFGDWQLAPSVRITSGIPINVLDGFDNSLNGEGLDRPNVVPGVSRYVNHYGGTSSLFYQVLNKAAFTPSAPGTFGNLSRNAAHAPGAVSVDTAVSRFFPIKERLQMEARFEAFNVINHANLDPTKLVVNLNNANFGRITGVSTPTFPGNPSPYDPRILQLALKLHF
ncbi:MAG TPA: carboxypeptidase regulatory-like domain-containing protein [Terriglobales bacterium]|nr:carboxypeptidase regulatory-like domain-containing protein [Terriglobales bacterium]